MIKKSPILARESTEATESINDNRVICHPQTWWRAASAPTFRFSPTPSGECALTPLLFAAGRGGSHHSVSRQSTDAKFVSERETLLEMARRHMREGAERVRRQEALVASLDRTAKLASQAALAKDVLTVLRRSLALMERHLREIEKRRRG